MRSMRASQFQRFLLIALSTIATNGFAQTGEPEVPEGIRASMTVDRSQAYVKEQILLTIKSAIPVNAFNLTSSKLAVEGVELVSLHRKEYTERFAGKPWQVEERLFALFGNQPGTVVIPAQRFRATLPVSTGASDKRRNPELTQTVPAQTVLVTPAPVSAADWLVATDVTISSQWSTPAALSGDARLRVGEPATRQLTIAIKGQHPAAITPVNATPPDAIQAYPDLPRLEILPTPDGLNGSLLQSTALVATRTGSITLPERSIRWWHSDAKQWRISTLAAERIDVVAGSSDGANGNRSASNHRFVIAALIGIILLLTALIATLMMRLNRIAHSQAGTRIHPPDTEAEAWSSLMSALATRNLAKIRSSLLDWHSCFDASSSATRLDQLVAVHASLARPLSDIDQTLYQSNGAGADVDLAELRAALIKLRNRTKSQPYDPPPGPSLYPPD